MKTFVKILLITLKCLIIALILLFSVATLVGKSYVQTGLLWMVVVAIAWWPPAIKQRWTKRAFSLSRWGLVFVLLLISFIAFKPEPKKSIYTSDQLKEELMTIYNEKVQDWPDDTRDIYIETAYGTVHVLACGSEENPPLVLIHAASMGAHSWAENLDPLLHHYRIYSIDNIGEGNRSVLKDALEFPDSQKEIADHFAFIMDALNVKSSPVFGASNGGFIATCYADHYPERVESLALFGPMGLTQLSGKSIMMLSIAIMYPFDFIRDEVTRWALGDDPYVAGKYGDWFNAILRGTIPSVAQPVPMSTEQKSTMEMPILLFLGTQDEIVGDVASARQLALEYPDIQIEVLESGHMVAIEHAGYVNSVVSEFLELPE
jgi:pimeloyl-ACP methyl ester carboxylesterase